MLLVLADWLLNNSPHESYIIRCSFYGTFIMPHWGRTHSKFSYLNFLTNPFAREGLRFKRQMWWDGLSKVVRRRTKGDYNLIRQKVLIKGSLKKRRLQPVIDFISNRHDTTSSWLQKRHLNVLATPAFFFFATFFAAFFLLPISYDKSNRYQRRRWNPCEVLPT